MSAYLKPTLDRCTCRECAASKLRSEPPTELELHRMQRARETGKAKNPAWYKVPAMPKPFAPDYRQYLPPHCRRGPGEVQSDTWMDLGEFTCFRKGRSGPPSSLKAYIKAYEKAKGLKHTKLAA